MVIINKAGGQPPAITFKAMSIKTNQRNELIPGEKYTIVRVSYNKSWYESEEITYRSDQKILLGDYTFYLSGHSLDFLPFINQCLKSNFEANPDAKLIKSVFSFIHNIPIGIIDLAWPKDQYGWLNDHLNEKYKSFCIKEGYASPNAILSFFATLDSENAMIFCRKIDQIIKSKS